MLLMRKTLLCLLISVLLAFPSLITEENSHSPSYSTARSETRSALSERYAEIVNYSDVMVIRNLNSLTSMQIADYFANERGIPWERICNVTVPESEVIDRTTFGNLRSQVENFMISNGLVEDVNFIVTTKGVPLKVWDSPWENSSSVDSELALINDIYAGSIGNNRWLLNPYFNASEPFSHSRYHFYIVTRITAFTKEEAMGLIDKASQAIGRRGTFLLDTDPRKGGAYEIGNDWMVDADFILRQKGFDVILDETNAFLTNYSDLAGYTSWGSNDGSWYIPENRNAGFEDDIDGDGVPDYWFLEDYSGTATILRSSLDNRTGEWSLEITRPSADNEFAAATQNLTIVPDRRYFLRGYANLTGVSSDQGAFLQARILNDLGVPIAILNGSARTGTTEDFVSLGQIILEPRNETRIQISAVLSKSNGTAFFDDVRLIDIKPHNSWVPGALAETYVSTGGRSFTYGTAYGQSLVADLLRDGVTGLKGYVYEPYLGAVAHPNILFKAYTEGYTLAESFSMASQICLSWMDAIIGDPKLAPYNVSYLPDLSINSTAIDFSPDPAVMGGSVNMSVNISNLGNFPTKDVVISFYRGDPRSGGVLLANRSVDVLHHSRNSTSIPLPMENLTRGEHQFCAYADSSDRYLETDESNNIACSNLTVLGFLHLNEGWNLISIPSIGSNTSIEVVLASIEGKYDMIRYYNSSRWKDPWKTYRPGRDPSLNEFWRINNHMGFWIHMKSEGDLIVGGTSIPTTMIRLKYGWNLVGYPSFTNRTVGDALAGVPWLRIEGFDPLAEPYRLRMLSPSDILSPGMGVWIKVSRDCWWVIEN